MKSQVFFRRMILALAMLAIMSASPRAECSVVVSPPLPDIGNRCVVVSIPTGYVVQNLDMEAWKHHLRSGDFSIEQKSSKTRINIEVGNDNLGRYKAFDLMPGTQFVTRSGLHGVLSVSHYSPERKVWSLVIPCKTWGGVGFVSVEMQPGTTHSDQVLAELILRRIRFVSAKHAPGMHSY